MSNKRIFVSCGQETDEEIGLGRRIIRLIGEQKGMEGFFAPEVHGADDLNRGVLRALKNCHGFFAVMHQRGGVTYRNYPVVHRASTWIQQQIGIIAYRSFLQGRRVPIRVYQQKGILLEGIMKTSIVSPLVFQQIEEVLEGLSKWLRGPDFEEDPVLARRESIFGNRIEGLESEDWVLLELTAAHSPDPSAYAPEVQIRKDFFAVATSKEEENFNHRIGRLSSLGLVDRTLHATAFVIRINKPWWDLIIAELRNQGRETKHPGDFMSD